MKRLVSFLVAIAACAFGDSPNVWGDVSFLYWQPFQDNMEVGLALDSVTTLVSGGATRAINIDQSQYVNMDFDFLPGFQLGLGVSELYDHWAVSLAYTRLHGQDSKSSSGGAVGLVPGLLDNAGMVEFLGAANLPYGSGRAAWRVKFDFLDVDLARPLFYGARFTFHPFFGLRGAWIREKWRGFYVNPSPSAQSNLNLTAGIASWGLGPRGGFDGSWKLWKGTRLFSNVEADLLYTRYHWLYQYSIGSPILLSSPFGFSSLEKGIPTVRAHIDLELGFGWETWIRQCHFDLAAGYGFQIFFNQNMFKYYFTTSYLPFNYAPISNLYIQGMTLKAKCEF